MTIRRAALAFALVLAGGPALAATCHMTVQGVPVIDDQACSAAGRRGDVLVTDAAGDTIRIRRALMTGRFTVQRPSDGRLRRAVVAYGPVVVSDASESDGKTCFFNQKAVLCVDP